jgi:ATP-binding cassette subfamily B (MDR/TAP) protein 1
VLNFIGLIAAAAAGAAQVRFCHLFTRFGVLIHSLQPLMTLIFGKLTNQFVGFGALVAQAGADSAALEDAAAAFRKTAALNALWLTLIGVFNFLCPLGLIFFF